MDNAHIYNPVERDRWLGYQTIRCAGTAHVGIRSWSADDVMKEPYRPSHEVWAAGVGLILFAALVVTIGDRVEPWWPAPPPTEPTIVPLDKYIPRFPDLDKWLLSTPTVPTRRCDCAPQAQPKRP